MRENRMLTRIEKIKTNKQQCLQKIEIQKWKKEHQK